MLLILLYNIKNMNKPKSNLVGNSPFIRLILGCVGWGIIYLIIVLFSGKLESRVPAIFLDLLLCVFGIVFWLFFFAQFVLPVRKTTDRQTAAQRLFDYLTGVHGPALFIESGVIHSRGSEKSRKGPGVILLDMASAALLQKPTHYTRAVGPGIVFTEKDETVGGTVDLHRQSSRLGPNDGDDTIERMLAAQGLGFEKRVKKESVQDHKDRLARRFETQAITRDNHEVVPNISVSFRLLAEEGEGNTRFGYRSESVRRAITGRPLDAEPSSETSPDRTANWMQLPTLLAVDIWREVLAKFTLFELYEQDPNEPVGRLQIVIQHVRDRLQKPMVDALDDYGKPILKIDTKGNPILGPDGQPLHQQVPSREFQILRARGIVVLGVSISNLRFRREDEERLLDHWKTTWLERAEEERKIVERRRALAAEQGRQQATIDFSLAVVQELGMHSKAEKLAASEILRLLIQGNIKLCTSDAQLIQMTREDIDNLQRILEWLEM